MSSQKRKVKSKQKFPQLLNCYFTNFFIGLVQAQLTELKAVKLKSRQTAEPAERHNKYQLSVSTLSQVWRRKRAAFVGSQ